jgi:hypothetical protein
MRNAKERRKSTTSMDIETAAGRGIRSRSLAELATSSM